MVNITLSIDDSLAEISTQGGLVKRFTVAKKDILYRQRKITTPAGLKNRGGIPILFPNADPITLPSKEFNLSQHGFARDKIWQIEKIEKDNCVLSLTADKQTLKQYPFKFRLILSIGLKKGEMNYDLEIINQERQKILPISPGLHPYFSLPIDQRQSIKVDIPKLNLKTFNWDSILMFPGQPVVNVALADKRKIKLSVSSQFKYWAVWGQKDLGFICLEPWIGKRNSLLKKDERVNILPSGKVRLSAKIIATNF